MNETRTTRHRRDVAAEALGKVADLMVAVLSMAAVSNAALLIDFDMSGRNAAEVQEPGWIEWIVAEAASDSKTISGATFKLSEAGSGSNLEPVWYKVGVQSPYYARLVCDGVTTDAASGSTRRWDTATPSLACGADTCTQAIR